MPAGDYWAKSCRVTSKDGFHPPEKGETNRGGFGGRRSAIRNKGEETQFVRTQTAR